MEKKRFGLIEVMVRTLFFTKTYKNLSNSSFVLKHFGIEEKKKISSSEKISGSTNGSLIIFSLILNSFIIRFSNKEMNI